jgi:hypothetical protein
MSGRSFLAFGILAVATLAAAPASACGTDDRFACASTASTSESKSTQTNTASKSQRGIKIRAQKKKLAAAKKTTRNAARARIIQASRSKTIPAATAKRSEETPRVESTRVESKIKTEAAKRVEVRVPAELSSAVEMPVRIETFAPVETSFRTERSAATLAPRYEIASADPAPLVAAPVAPTSDLLSPIPTAGAPEIIRLAAPRAAPETEQITNSVPTNAVPIVAASEAPTVEFKSDPARLFATPAAASERTSPRKNAPSGLSWMQAILLALGGGIVAISMFKLFSASNKPA